MNRPSSPDAAAAACCCCCSYIGRGTFNESIVLNDGSTDDDGYYGDTTDGEN
jgi:hypothetical protein